MKSIRSYILQFGFVTSFGTNGKQEILDLYFEKKKSLGSL